MHYICPSIFHIGTIYKLPTSSSKRSIYSNHSLLVYSTYIFSLYYFVVSTKKTRLLNLVFLISTLPWNREVNRKVEGSRRCSPIAAIVLCNHICIKPVSAILGCFCRNIERLYIATFLIY